MGCISSQPETTICKILERLNMKVQNLRRSDESLEVEIRASYQEIINLVKREQKVMQIIEIEIEKFTLCLKIQRPALYYLVEKDSIAIFSFMQVYNSGTVQFHKHSHFGMKKVNSVESTPLKVPRKITLYQTADEEDDTDDEDIEDCPCPRVKRTRDMRQSDTTDPGDVVYCPHSSLRLKRMFFYANHNATDSQETLGDFGFYDKHDDNESVIVAN